MSDTKTPSFYERLATVQVALKVPKSQQNSFGNYSYRSAEDILEAVKPLLPENRLTLLLSDDVVNIGQRFYVRAHARVVDTLNPETFHEVTAFAREDEDKKGMDGSQITGTASSYARKYALNGLFLIDDTKDADTDEHHTQTASGASKPAPQPTVSSRPASPAPTQGKAPPQGLTPETTEAGICEIDGRVVQGKSVYWSLKKCDGHVYCYDHQQDYKAGTLTDPNEQPNRPTIEEELHGFMPEEYR